MQQNAPWHKKTWSRKWFTTLRATNVSCIDVNSVLALLLWKIFLIRNSANMKIMRDLIIASGTLQIERCWQSLRMQRDFDDVSNDIARHSKIAKLKITSSWFRTKSKVTTGVKNTASYIALLHATWYKMVASNLIRSVLVLMTTTITQAFCIKFKQCLFFILKLITNI